MCVSPKVVRNESSLTQTPLTGPTRGGQSLCGCCMGTGKGSCRQRSKGRAQGPPIDVGWAWVVLAAAFGIYGLHGAAFKLQGMIYVEMVDHFHSSPQATLWVLSLSGLVMLSSGPFVSLLIAKTSHRTVMLLGTAAVTGGTILTGYMPVMEATFITWGIVYGFGHCCLLMTSLTCTASYFNKYRGLAVGIAASGSGALSFILPIAMRHLLDSMSFEGALLLYGGILMHVFVLAMFVRPISYYDNHRAPVNKEDDEDLLGPSDTAVVLVSLDSSMDEIPADIEMLELADMTADKLLKHNVLVPSAVFLKTECSELENQLALSASSEEMVDSEPLKSKVLPAVTPLTKTALSACTLLRDSRMWAISLTMLFFANGMNIVFTVIPPYGDSIGVPKEEVSILLAVGGAFEVVFRALHGWFSDRRIISALLQLAFCSCFTGLAAILCPIFGGQVGIGILTAATGFTGTSAFSLAPVVVHEMLGAENVTLALGIQMFFRGFSFILSTFMTGFFLELTESWDAIFYYIGANMMVSTLISGGFAIWSRKNAVPDDESA